MAIIIGGCPRSGTTLLRNICNSHPAIIVTMEFDNFDGLDRSFRGYSRQVLRKWWRDRRRSFLVQGESETHWQHVLKSHIFVARYLLGLSRHRGSAVDVSAIEATLKTIFPKASVFGDKMPYYVFRLQKLVQVDRLTRIVIYRDCRDVVSSTLRMVRTDWRGRPFTREYDTAAKVAHNWVNAIEMMECYADKLHIIRYEDLVRAPQREIQRLGTCLGVDSEGFPRGVPKESSVGKHKGRLIEGELSAVMDVAGSTMTRLGYV